eukprot:6838818-Heterocapsa_arctica.AAC.1
MVAAPLGAVPWGRAVVELLWPGGLASSSSCLTLSRYARRSTAFLPMVSLIRRGVELLRPGGL